MARPRLTSHSSLGFACHTASDRAAILMQCPTAGPYTNLRYRPGQ